MEDSQTNGTAVKVTMKDIYLEVQRQGKLLEKIANSLPDTEDVVDDHEQQHRWLVAEPEEVLFAVD